MRGLIGKKVGMTRIFDENGHIIPITVLEAGPCVVTQVKTIENFQDKNIFLKQYLFWTLELF